MANPFSRLTQVLWPFKSERAYDGDPTEIPVLPGGTTNRTKRRVKPSTALTIPTVLRAVDAVSSDIAQLSANVYRRTDQGKIHLNTHSTQRLLRNPSWRYSKHLFYKTIVSHVKLWGEGFAYILRNQNGVPIELILRHPRDVDVWVDEKDDDRVWYRDHKIKRLVRAQDMLHFYELSDDGLRGISRIRYTAETLGVAIAQREMAADYYGGQDWSRGYMKLPTVEKIENIKSIRKLFSESIRRGEPGMLQGGAEYHELKIPMQEAQWFEGVGLSTDQICQIFSFPPHKAYHMANMTMSNVEQMDRNYAKDSILPALSMMEQEMWRKLISDKEKDDTFIRHNVKGLLRGSPQEQAEWIKTMRETGAYSVDEIRDVDDRNPLPNGEGQRHVVNSAYYPLDRWDELMDATIAQKMKGLTDGKPTS